MEFHVTKHPAGGWHVLFAIGTKAVAFKVENLDEVFRTMRYEAAYHGAEGTLEQACEKSMRDDPPKQPRHVDGAKLDPHYWLGVKRNGPAKPHG